MSNRLALIAPLFNRSALMASLVKGRWRGAPLRGVVTEGFLPVRPIIVHDGAPAGGTAQTVRYAKTQGVDVVITEPGDCLLSARDSL